MDVYRLWIYYDQRPYGHSLEGLIQWEHDHFTTLRFFIRRADHRDIPPKGRFRCQFTRKFQFNSPDPLVFNSKQFGHPTNYYLRLVDVKSGGVT